MVALFLLTLLFFAEVIFTHNTFIARDTYLFYNPRQFYAAESMHAGILPLWNPYVACGVPFHANLQSAIFYPFNALYYFLPFQQGFKYFIVLHYFLGASFMFLLMRAWGASRKGAVLSGIVFAFGGYLLSINDNVAFLAAGIWLPLVMLCFHRAAITGRLYYSVLTGVCIAAQIFAGDASFFLLSSFIGTFLYALYQGVMHRSAPACSRSKLPGCFALSWGIGLGLAAVQLIPFLEFAASSHRFPGLDFAQAAKWSYHPLEMLQLIIPYIFGSTVPGTRWFGQLWLDTLYVGIFPLILVFVALAWGREKLRYYLAGLLAVSLLLSFGEYTPIYRFLYENTPVIKMVQYPVKFLFLAGFALAALAGKGLDLFFDVADDHKKANVLAGVLGACIIALAVPLAADLFLGDSLFAKFLTFYPANDYLRSIVEKQFYESLSGCWLALTLCLLCAVVCIAARKNRLLRAPLVAVIFLLVVYDLKEAKPVDPLIRETAISERNETAALLQKDPSLYRIYSLARFHIKGFGHLYDVPFARVYKVLRDSLRANLNMYEHIASAEEYSECLNRSFYDLVSPLESYFSEDGSDLKLRAYCSMLFNLLNVKYIISPLPLKGFGFKLIASQPAYVYENETVMPRAFFPQRIERFASDEDVLARIKSPGFDPREIACVLSVSPEGENAPVPESTAASLVWDIEWTGYAPQRCSLKTKTNKSGFLVVSDTFYPGWKVFVDGTESRFVKANHFMRGVVVAQGRHEVLFVFRPLSFTIGCWISALFLVISMSLLIKSLRQDRRQKGA